MLGDMEALEPAADTLRAESRTDPPPAQAAPAPRVGYASTARPHWPSQADLAGEESAPPSAAPSEPPRNPPAPAGLPPVAPAEALNSTTAAAGGSGARTAAGVAAAPGAGFVDMHSIQIGVLSTIPEDSDGSEDSDGQDERGAARAATAVAGPSEGGPQSTGRAGGSEELSTLPTSSIAPSGARPRRPRVPPTGAGDTAEPGCRAAALPALPTFEEVSDADAGGAAPSSNLGQSAAAPPLSGGPRSGPFSGPRSGPLSGPAAAASAGGSSLEDIERARAEGIAAWRARHGIGVGDEDAYDGAVLPVAPASWGNYAGERTRNIGTLVDAAAADGNAYVQLPARQPPPLSPFLFSSCASHARP